MSNDVIGVTDRQDISTALISRDTRGFFYRLADSTRETAPWLWFLIAFIMLVMPFVPVLDQNWDVAVGSLAIYYLYSRKKVYHYPYREPIRIEDGGKVGNGLILLGRNKEDLTGAYISNEDSRAHVLVFGTTGSGKTRFLLGLLYQALLMRSGVIYVDGKADTSVLWLVYSLVRRMGRMDDFLVINYITGGARQGADGKKFVRVSNTTNPFSFGPADTLRSMISSLMRDGKGDGDMWKGRARAMLGALLETLVYLRDDGQLELDIMALREAMPLDRVIELTQRDDIPSRHLDPLKKFLLELPGFSEQDALTNQINPKAYEQHNYLTMQLTESLADLTETYAHIFRARRGEVDWRDVVFNRRILMVLLPSLEKDPDSLAALGKLVIAGVRSALAPALGTLAEGTKREVVDSKPTNSPVPFMMIFDEYGYYAVKGFAVVAAQARSLGISVVFAAQDYPSLKKASEEEAASTVANTSTKICMKLEDADATLKIFEARGGESTTEVTAGHERGTGLGGSYMDQKGTRLERVKRINVRDLVRQGPGQAHVLFGDKLTRCDLFYADPYQVEEARQNRYLMVLPAPRNVVEQFNASARAIADLATGQEARAVESKPDEALLQWVSDYSIARARNESRAESALIATGMIELREVETDIALSKPQATEAAMTVQPTSVVESAQEPRQHRIQIDRRQDLPPEARQLVTETVRAERGSSLHLEAILDKPPATDSVSVKARHFTEAFDMAVRENMIRTYRDKAMTASPAELEAHSPANRLEAAATALGATDPGEDARRALDMLDDSVEYPTEPHPEKSSADVLRASFDQLRKQLRVPNRQN